MAWAIEYTDQARQQLRKFDRLSAKRILDDMDERVAVLDDPRSLGKALSGPLGTFWRYRVGDYRVICDVQEGVIRVLVVRVGHRSNVYR